MREPPSNLAPEALHAMVEAAYGLAIAELRFLPLGHDSSAWVYRVQMTDGTLRFLKLRVGPLNQAGIRVPHFLHAHGVPGVVAPIATRSGALWAELDHFRLILYPFVDGTSGMAARLTDQQWVAYGAALRQFHSASVPPELATLMRREAYTPQGAAVVRQVDSALQTTLPAEPSARALAVLWHARRAKILELLERAETLGQALAGHGLPWVLCHADIHTGNVLRDGEAQVWIVDWDETMLAPKERDLMFVIGGISEKLVEPREEALFLQGYGPASVDRAALAYYRYAWAVSDIAAYSADVLFRPDLGAATRAEAVSGLHALFAPGEIVSIAGR